MKDDAARQNYWDNLAATLYEKASREQAAFLASPEGKAKKEQDLRHGERCYQKRLAKQRAREQAGE